MKATYNKNVNIAGNSFSEIASIDADVNQDVTVDQPAAQAGTLTTRTDNTDGTVTMTSSGHTITTGVRVDLYWTGGCRRGVTVGTVSGTAVPISGGAGDNLPSTSTAIKVALPTKRTLSFTGNNLKAIACKGTVRSQFTVTDSGSAELYSFYNSGGKVPSWYYGSDDVNPLAGVTPAFVYVSHGETADDDLMISVLLSQ